MLNKCVVCPYRLGNIKTFVNPCLQCSSELRERQPFAQTSKEEKDSSNKKNG